MRLDDPASDHLRTVPLADSAVTIRKLLSYSGGVDTPAPDSGYADTVSSRPGVAVRASTAAQRSPRDRQARRARRLRRARAAHSGRHRFGLRCGRRAAFPKLRRRQAPVRT